MTTKKVATKRTALVKKYLELWEDINEKQKELKLIKAQLYEEMEPGERIGRLRNEERNRIVVTDKLISEIKKAGLAESILEEKVCISKLREAVQFNPALSKFIKTETTNVITVMR